MNINKKVKVQNLNLSKLISDLIEINRSSVQYQIGQIENYKNPRNVNYPYIPIDASMLTAVFIDILKLKDYESKSFIDIGAGNNAVINIANILGFKKPKGLEINKLYLNLDIDNNLIEGDLTTFDFKDFDILYSYNPIRKASNMKQGLLNIVKTMKSGSIFYYCNACVPDDYLESLGFKKIYFDTYKLIKE